MLRMGKANDKLSSGKGSRLRQASSASEGTLCLVLAAKRFAHSESTSSHAR